MKRTTETCPYCGQRIPPAGHMRPLRTCARPDCGREFRNRRTDAVYCSKACAKVMAQRAYRERHETAEDISEEKDR